MKLFALVLIHSALIALFSMPVVRAQSPLVQDDDSAWVFKGDIRKIHDYFVSRMPVEVRQDFEYFRLLSVDETRITLNTAIDDMTVRELEDFVRRFVRVRHYFPLLHKAQVTNLIAKKGCFIACSALFQMETHIRAELGKRTKTRRLLPEQIDKRNHWILHVRINGVSENEIIEKGHGYTRFVMHGCVLDYVFGLHLPFICTEHINPNNPCMLFSVRQRAYSSSASSKSRQTKLEPGREYIMIGPSIHFAGETESDVSLSVSWGAWFGHDIFEVQDGIVFGVPKGFGFAQSSVPVEQFKVRVRDLLLLD